MAAQAVGHPRVQAGDWASRICCGCVWRQQMLEGARVLRRPGHVGARSNSCSLCEPPGSLQGGAGSGRAKALLCGVS